MTSSEAVNNFDVTDGWIAYLTNYAVDICLKRSINHCTGCIDCKAAPLAHKHLQLGLHGKLGCYFDGARDTIIEGIEELYLNYTYQLSQPSITPNLIEIGINFIKNTTPSDLYFGNYKPDFNEIHLESVYKQYFCQSIGSRVGKHQTTPIKRIGKPQCPRKPTKIAKKVATAKKPKKNQVHMEKLSQ